MSMDPRSPGPFGVLGRIGLFLVFAVIAGLLAGLAGLPIIGGIGVASRDAIQGFESLPDTLTEPPLPQHSTILAADGSVLATVYYQNRVEVPLSSVAPVMRQAIVAVEDARFLEHNGIDLRGTMRAVATNTSAGGVQQGGSTLTQQYVKNVLITQATNKTELDDARGRTPIRKLREIRYALALEKRYTKDEILERYLNIAYFGAGAYGIEAAAHRYFSKSAADLTLPEAATLAGIVQQPTAYDPLRNPDLSTKRRNVVLQKMASQGYISASTADDVSLTPMGELIKPSITPNGCTSSYAPYFCFYVLNELKNDPTFGATPEEREQYLKQGGLTITTTLQPQKQDAAMQAVLDHIPMKDSSRRAAAIAMVEPGTGQIVAMAQNRKWGTSGVGKTTYNYAVNKADGGTIGMQAGSTFKIFTLAAALEAGISPFEVIESPDSRTFKGFKNCSNGTPFEPVTIHNSTGSGSFDMRAATAYSVNTYFMAIEQRTGLCRPVEIAESMGVTLADGNPLLAVPTFTLGTMEVSPLAMANAFATFANHGVYCKPIAISKILDRNGKLMPVPSADCHEVIKSGIADAVTSMLTGVIDGYLPGRTGAAMSLADRPAAGKTGTTNDSAAVWFSGFTPDLAASVWVGDPRGGYRYPMKNVVVNGRYYSQVFGSTLPGPIWKQAMTGALEGSKPVAFDLQDQWGLEAARGTGSYYPTTPTVTKPTKKPDKNNTDSGGATPAPAPAPAPEPAPAPAPTDAPAPADPAAPAATG